MLTEEQIAHYYREGYVVVRGLIPAATIEKVRKRAEQETPTSMNWTPRIFKHEEPEKDADIHALLAEPNIIAAVQDLLGTEPRVYYGMLAIVPANGGNGLPWHQDNMYTQILGGALNTFVALSEITPEKANLWVAPQSHRLGTLPSDKNETTAKGHREAQIEPENGMLLPTLQPGDAVIFDRNTLHRSLKNETDTHRYAYAAQYQADHARQAWDGSKDPKRMRARELAALWG
jgi:ectoine hydroxylase-related dioxygenase (phytanoyl-CoA dioxygenase family)